MEKKVLKVDCHCHPLDHMHYPEPAWNAHIGIEAKVRTEAMLISAIKRGLDAVCITDHNQFSSAMFARRYADEHKLPIKVVIGSECSVFVDGQEIHVLALGVTGSFEFDEHDTVENLVNIIHAIGGLAVLSHPHYYPMLAKKVIHLMDGIEEYNGVAAANGSPIMNFKDFKGFYTQGSDYHIKPGRTIHEDQASACTLIEEGHPLWNLITK